MAVLRGRGTDTSKNKCLRRAHNMLRNPPRSWRKHHKPSPRMDQELVWHRLRSKAGAEQGIRGTPYLFPYPDIFPNLRFPPSNLTPHLKSYLVRRNFAFKCPRYSFVGYKNSIEEGERQGKKKKRIQEKGKSGIAWRLFPRCVTWCGTPGTTTLAKRAMAPS